jgi:hypothetical protein
MPGTSKSGWTTYLIESTLGMRPKARMAGNAFPADLSSLAGER